VKIDTSYGLIKDSHDSITESIELIEILFSVIKDCPLCHAKLKESKLNNDNAGVTSPQRGHCNHSNQPGEFL
jgi:hypothetical protein